MGRGVQNCEAQHRVRQLPVKPKVLVEGKEAEFGPKPSHDGSANGKQDKHPVNTENQPSTS